MQDIIIRNLQLEDCASLMEIDQLVFDHTNTPSPMKKTTVEEYAKHYSPDSVFVAVADERIAGYIGYHNPTGLASNSHVMELYIAVHPDFQKMGVGRKLLNHLTEWGRNKGFKKISLRVLALNEKAITFYLSNGFREQGRMPEEFLLDGRYVDDILMYKML